MAERLKIMHGHINRPYLNSTNGIVDKNILEGRIFKYTLNNSLLSLTQRQFYEANGYIVIPGLVEHDLLDQFSARFADICEGRTSKGGMVLMKDISLAKSGVRGEYLYNKLQDIHHDEVFEKYTSHSKILDVVSCFTGPNIKVLNSMLINKPPDSGKFTSRHPTHQDLYYLPIRPADRTVAAWTAMEKITVDNGCLSVIPGSHKGELHPHDYPKWEGGVNKASHEIKGFENYELLPLLMEKGETVFFHPLIIHGSGANNTRGFRKAISCHYVASECYFIDVKGTIQEKISEELMGILAMRDISSSIEEFWKLKTKLVRGVDKTI